MNREWLGFTTGRSSWPLWPVKILHTHHLLPTLCQFEEKLTLQTNSIQNSLCSAKKLKGQISVNL